jgi:hypothetical protein
MQGFHEASHADDDPHLRSLRPPVRRRNHVCGSASDAVSGNLRLRPGLAARQALESPRRREAPLRPGLPSSRPAGETNVALRYPAACN